MDTIAEGSSATTARDRRAKTPEQPIQDANRDIKTRIRQTYLPRVLGSVQDLNAIIDSSRNAVSRSTEFDGLPSLHLSVYPTFTRFARTPFAKADRLSYELINSVHTHWYGNTTAEFYMSYPINLTLRDGRNVPIASLPELGIPDCAGYPLLYRGQTTKIVKAKPSGCFFPIKIKQPAITLLETDTSRAAARLAYKLNSGLDEIEQSVLKRAFQYRSGDNHVVLLVKAYLAYLDSIAAAVSGTIMGRNELSKVGKIFNIKTSRSWMTELSDSTELVIVCGEPVGYQEFWAHCCFNRPPVFAAKPSGINFFDMCSSPFSNYAMEGMDMACLCDVPLQFVSQQPYFYGKPNLILSYIEKYVSTNGLQYQANEALQIAMLWPCILQTNAPIALPKPLHTADWFIANVECPVGAASPYAGLASSNPYVVLASTLAGAWAQQCQLYDYVGMLSAKRNTRKLPKLSHTAAASWLHAHASAPGVGWDLLFRYQFATTPSFLYLTGLNVSSTVWGSLLSRFSNRERRFPAHLRLIQPFWMPTSVSAAMPWEDAWKPSLRYSPQTRLLSASSSTIMRMLRLGLLGNEVDVVLRNLYQSLKNDGIETIEILIKPVSLVQIQQVREHGIRVVANLNPLRATKSSSSRNRVARPQERWPIDGLLQNITIQDLAPDATLAPKIMHKIPGMANPTAIHSAEQRLKLVQRELAESRSSILARASDELQRLGSKSYAISESYPPVHEVAYKPKIQTGDGALWCILYCLRSRNEDQASLSCLTQTLKRSSRAILDIPASLQVEQMAGICVALGVYIQSIHSKDVCLEYLHDPELESQPICSLSLQLHSNCWQVNQNHLVLAAADKKIVDIRNMPTNAALADPEITTEAPPVPDHAPSNNVPYNLATRVRLLEEAVARWDNDLIATDEAIGVHRLLFPKSGIPRFLIERDDATSVTQPFSTNSQGSFPAIIKIDAQTFLERRYGSEYIKTLRAFAHAYLNDPDESILVWPHRSPETMSKNNVTTVELLSILDACVPQEALAIWFLQSCQGNHAEFVTAVSLWLAGANLCSSAWSEFLSTGLLDANEDSWLDRSKEFHDTWRKNGLRECRCSSCWSQLLYLHSLWGRGGVEVDWNQEISNKATVPDDILAFTGQVWSAEYATSLIRESMQEVLGTARDNLQLVSFDIFMDEAYEWIVGGSAAGMPSVFRGTDIKSQLRRLYNIATRATKRSVMEAIPREYVKRILSTRPQIIAKLHQKQNETGGKARAIYGVAIWHYIFSNWLTAIFERAVRHPSIDINVHNNEFVSLTTLRAQAAKQKKCFSSYDFPDFNAMHTHYHMSIIYEVAASVARSCGAFSDLNQPDRDLVIQGYEWLRESVFVQACLLPNTDTFIQSIGGLYSGNRDTTLINTLLNIAYSRVVDISCRNMGIDPTIDWRLCHGDDIITVHRSYAAAIGWNVVAEHANLKGQEKKLLTDRSYHEYLRIMGCPDGILRGCLARVVATFVNGNWETDYVPGAHNKVVELQSALDVLERRGMRPALIAKLLDGAMRRLAASIPASDADGIALRGAVLNINKLKHNAANNYEAEDLAVKINTDATYPENQMRTKLDVERWFSSMPSHVTEPYARKLVQMLPPQLQQQAGLSGRLKAILQKSTYGSELPQRMQIDVKQTPQLIRLQAETQKGLMRRGQFERHINISDVGRHLSNHKPFAKTLRRIKTVYVLLSALKNLGGYTKPQLVAYICKLPQELVESALLADGYIANDWRRIGRPSAPEVGALENELELYLTGRSMLRQDEEVVIYADDGMYNNVPARSLMMY